MPPTTTAPSRLARALTAAAATLLLSIGSLAAATPASAHDELRSSDPAAGATLETPPEQLTLTFSGEISTEAGATEIQVTDADGTSLTDGDPVVEGAVVTQPLTDAASGAVTVLWKVVSSDGHPISGELGFTVTAPPTPTPTPTATPTETPTATPTAEPTPTPTVSPEPADSTFSDVWPWIVGAVIVAGLGGALIYLLVSRNRRLRDGEALRASAAEAAAGRTPTGDPGSDSPGRG